jgi:hypothetical protein
MKRKSRKAGWGGGGERESESIEREEWREERIGGILYLLPSQQD